MASSRSDAEIELVAAVTTLQRAAASPGSLESHPAASAIHDVEVACRTVLLNINSRGVIVCSLFGGSNSGASSAASLIAKDFALPEAAQLLLRLLRDVSAADGEAYDAAATSVAEAVQRRMDDGGLLQQVFECFPARMDEAIAEALVAQSFHETMITVLETHRTDAATCYPALRALNGLLAGLPSGAVTFGLAKDECRVDMIPVMLHLHVDNADIVEAACSTLNHVCDNQFNSIILHVNEATQRVLTALRRHVDNVAVARTGMQALCHIVSSADPASVKGLAKLEADSAALALAVLEKHAGDVKHAVHHASAVLVAVTSETAVAAASTASMVRSELFKALDRRSDDTLAVAAMTWALAETGLSRPLTFVTDGGGAPARGASSMLQFKAASRQIMAALQRHSSSEATLQPGFGALAQLAVEAEGLASVVESRAVALMADAMARFVDSADLTASALELAVALLEGSPRMAAQLISAGVGNVAASCLERFAALADDRPSKAALSLSLSNSKV